MNLEASWLCFTVQLHDHQYQHQKAQVCRSPGYFKLRSSGHSNHSSQFKSLESWFNVSTIYMYLLSSESELCPNTVNAFTAFSGRLFKECSAVTLHERITSLLPAEWFFYSNRKFTKILEVTLTKLTFLIFGTFIKVYFFAFYVWLMSETLVWIPLLSIAQQSHMEDLQTSPQFIYCRRQYRTLA